MAARAATAPRPRPVRAPSLPPEHAARRPPPRARSRARLRLTRGVVWIVVVAALLGGIVALNVAALRLRMQGEEIGSRAADIRVQLEALRAELASASALGRVQAAASERLGLVAPAETTFVELESRQR